VEVVSEVVTANSTQLDDLLKPLGVVEGLTYL
jgi:hypothetical protein